MAKLNEAVVKPLEWVAPYQHDNTSFAETMLGTWTVWDFGGEDSHVRGPQDKAGRRIGGDIESAKAVAQADYEARIRSALVAPASLPDGWVAVPETALKWLFGEGPDEDGNWFGDGATSDKGRYWWRASFRAMLPAAPANAKGE